MQKKGKSIISDQRSPDWEREWCKGATYRNSANVQLLQLGTPANDRLEELAGNIATVSNIEKFNFKI